MVIVFIEKEIFLTGTMGLLIIIVAFQIPYIDTFFIQKIAHLSQPQKAIAQSTFSSQNKPAFLKIVVRVNNTAGGTATPSDFQFSLLGTDAFRIYGSETGTIVTLPNGGHYSIFPVTKVVNGIAYGFAVSGGDCRYEYNSFLGATASGTIKPGEKHTCVITEIAAFF
jgi:hypothetical protein